MTDERDGATRREVLRWRRAARGRPARVPAPGPGQESVWDYPRPPRIERVAKRVRVEFAGVTLAETTQALRVCETASPPTYYLPPECVRRDLLEPAPGTSLCEWKGTARYFSVRIGEHLAPRAAWCYPRPFAEYRALTDYLSFFPGRVDACFVADERVTPQPGDFYGGWVTKNLTGPFKGEPGSEGW
jgi:uncharacterized protein (DUF427 family)